MNNIMSELADQLSELVYEAQDTEKNQDASTVAEGSEFNWSEVRRLLKPSDKSKDDVFAQVTNFMVDKYLSQFLSDDKKVMIVPQTFINALWRMNTDSDSCQDVLKKWISLRGNKGASRNDTIEFYIFPILSMPPIPHWSLIAADTKYKTFYIVDSTQGDKEYHTDLITQLGALNKYWRKFEQYRCKLNPIQKNQNDCGVLMLRNMQIIYTYPYILRAEKLNITTSRCNLWGYEHTVDGLELKSILLEEICTQ